MVRANRELKVFAKKEGAMPIEEKNLPMEGAPRPIGGWYMPGG
ncbi:hypothetical protein [Labilibaculum euxinus]|nr:hypothetical protein [Labilibaculum euxinus]MDQ1770776.1 hypothetical protein [Labilibaculum euxinus]